MSDPIHFGPSGAGGIGWSLVMLGIVLFVVWLIGVAGQTWQVH